MIQSHCLIYCTLNKIYTLHGIEDSQSTLSLIDNFEHNSITKISKFIDEDCQLENLIIKDFLVNIVNFYTNVKSDTNFYELIKSKLPSNNLTVLETLNIEELDKIKFRFTDFIIGNDITFTTPIYRKRIISYLERDEICDNLIPYLYFINCTKLKASNWLKVLGKNQI